VTKLLRGRGFQRLHYGMSVWRKLRIVALLFVLATVAQGAWIARGRTTEWNNTVRVVIYPINGDHSAVADRYLGKLEASGFETIEAFFRQQAAGYGLGVGKPIEIRLAPMVSAQPPLLGLAPR